MKVDVHNHLGYDPEFEESRSSRDLIKEMAEVKVNKCLIFPFTTNPDIVGQNVIIKKSFDAYPNNFVGFFLMNPKLPEMTNLMYEYKAQKFKGVVTDPRFGVRHGEKRFHELVECAIVLEFPIWLHTDNQSIASGASEDIPSLERLISKYPMVSFILSSIYYDAIGIATRHKNVYIDTTVLDTWQIPVITRPIGTNRILMGSNTPYGLLRREVDRVKNLVEITDFQKTLIFWENSKRLLQL
jgi:predicted TIM-barrel fold metal-dependent hydrolase